MKRAILFVDDEPNLLAAVQRQTRKRFDIRTAVGGEEGLAVFEKEGPFGVVVSDLRMPGMNGIEFLGKIREMSPETVRLMLTGFADLEAAMEAVNESNIFRFLTKPCPPTRMIKALEDALDQFDLVTAEKELLEKTLSGAVKVLVEVLSMVNPNAFSRASRIKKYVSQLARVLGLENRWRFEVAALLSHLGCVTLSQETLDKVLAGRPLTAEERDLYGRHPQVAASLLKRIPRMEEVAAMVEGQYESPPESGKIRSDPVLLGAQLIRLATALDQKIAMEKEPRAALEELRKEKAAFPGFLLEAAGKIEAKGGFKATTRLVGLKELRVSMVLDENVYAQNGILLAPKGQEVNVAVIERLRGFAGGVGIKEPFRVIVDEEEEEEEPALSIGRGGRER